MEYNVSCDFKLVIVILVIVSAVIVCMLYVVVILVIVSDGIVCMLFFAGKVRVKILTNRDAIRQFGGQGGGMQILSEQETNQFKDMIMSLLVSCPGSSLS